MLARLFARRLALASAAVLLAAAGADAGRPRFPHEAVGRQLFASPHANPIALSPDGAWVYVANTTSNTVSVISTATSSLVATVEVGIEPVGIAVRPDGLEVWVSNHVSDTLSVIDTNPVNGTWRQVVETVQAIDANGVTLFDEPVGIAFTPDSKKAYVALSSRNQVAVVPTPLCDAACAATYGGSVTPYAVARTLTLTAQEPRALAVRDGLLYVASFESGNRSELSACPSGGTAPQCTLDLTDLVAFATNPNLPNEVKNIVDDPQVPDRDLFVFRTSTDALVTTVSGIGTLLYGVAAGPSGKVFITQTDARNLVNGLHDSFLLGLGNRMFTNEVAFVDCNNAVLGGSTCSFSAASDVKDLEPASPTQTTALATPFGAALSADGSILVGTAAASNRVFTLNTTTRNVQATLGVGDIPRGVAFLSTGATGTAYVLNALGNTVSLVTVGSGGALTAAGTIAVGADPTPQAVRRGHVAFNSGFASTKGTFSCASCHPDGNTDQLLWRIGGGCFLAGCDNDNNPATPPPGEPRSTMPVRGLKNTLPLHWDGTLGDPFGGGNGAVGFGGAGGTDCDLGGPEGDHDCFRDLVNESLAGVMCDQTLSCSTQSELSEQEREDMAFFLASVAYPPARMRRLDDTLSRPGEGVMVGTIEVSARTGFSDFFTNQGGNAGDPDTCADSSAGCHTLPLGAATNSSTLQGFDVPTMRGMTDRFLQFSLGITNAEEVLVFADAGFAPGGLSPLEAPIKWLNGANGFREITTFGSAFAIFQPVYNVRPLHTFQMFEEASTGFAGAVGRQVTLSTATTNGPALAGTEALMTALEEADAMGLVNLRAVGIRAGAPLTLSYRSTAVYKALGGFELTHAQLLAEAQAGTTLMTLTAALRSGFGDEVQYPQPLLSVGVGTGPTGDPPLPVVGTSPANPNPFSVIGTAVRADAALFMDGQKVTGAISCVLSGVFCQDGSISVDLDALPDLAAPAGPDPGLHLLQVQNGPGPLSNELPVCVGSAAGCQ
jgi:YVTN family beta-propeller protein